MIKKFLNKDIILLFIISLTPLLWYGFGGNKLIASFDAGYPLNPLEFIKNGVSVWFSSANFGYHIQGSIGNFIFHGVEGIITLLTKSVFIGQEIYSVFWFFFPMAAMYYVIRKIPAFRDKPYMALFAAILFQFNLFQFQGWGGIWITRFSVYAALPIIFLLFIDYFEERRSLLKSSLFIGLVLFLLNGGGSPPLFGAIILLTLVTVSYYLFLNLPNWFAFVKKSLLLAISVFIVTFLLSAYWVIPYLSYVLASYSSTIAAGGGSTLTVGWTDVVSRNASILNLLRLQGLDFIETVNFNDGIKVFLTNPILIAASFLWPILAFGSILLAKIKEKRYIILLSLVAIVAIPFTAASHEPFREFYIFLLKVVPGFPIFRTALYKFGGLLWFSYAILIAFSLSCIIEIIKTKLQKRKSGLAKIPVVLSSVFIFFILAFDFPIFSNRLFNWNPPLTMLEKIPQYVFDFGNWIDKQNISERTLLLPKLNDGWHAEAFKWGYWSLSPATAFLTRKNFIGNDASLVGPEMFLLNDLYKDIENNQTSWQKSAGALGIEYLLLRNDFFSDLNWSPSTSPAIYQKILESNENIKKIKTFGEWAFYKINNDASYLPLIYSPDSLIYSYTPESATAEVLNSAKTDRPLVIFENNQGNSAKEPPWPLVETTVVQAECVLCDPSETPALESGIQLTPFVRFLPDSVFYPLIIWKEKRQFNAYKNIPSARIDTDLGFAGKRLSEIGVILSGNKENKNTLIWNNIQKYFNYINDAMGQIDRLSDKEKNNYLVRILAYLNGHYKFIGTKFDEDNNISYDELLLFLQRNINNLSKRTWVASESTQKKYTFEINKTDNYAVYLKNQDILPQEFLIDGEKTEKNLNSVFLEKGIHKAELIYSDFPNLLLPDQASSSAKLSLGQENNTQFGIRDLDFRSKYQIVFNYRVEEGKAPVFLITQDNDSDNKEGGKNRVLKVPLLADGKWHQFKYTFSPNFGAKEAVLAFYQTSPEQNTDLEINSFKIEKIFTPQIFFTSETQSKELSIPKITFQKINPTEYVVHIKNATGPYFLNFGQRYDSGWKVYPLANNKQVRIEELYPQEKFIDKNFLTTLFIQSISEKNHFQANGYANSWYIDKNGNYDLLIIYWPQRLYYLGLVFSLVSLIAVLSSVFLWRK